MSTRAALRDSEGRALDPDGSVSLFDEVKEGASHVLDLFTGITQEDVSKGHVDLSELSREDRIQLLIDHETSSVFGSSPWSVGVQLDQSVATEVHANNGATLVFGINASALDLAESAVRSVRYALVWDDAFVAETGTLDINVIGKTFLIIGIDNEPQGKVLTLWLTDNDLSTPLVKQGRKQDIDKIRTDLLGDLKRDSGNPIGDAANKVLGFFTVSQIGGVVALAVVGVVLIILVRSQTAQNIAKNVRVAV